MALAVRDFTVSAGPLHVTQDLHWELPVGATAAVVGACGCGKSVLLRALCGLHPSQGVVSVAAVDSATHGFAAVRAQLGVVQSVPALLDDLTVEGNVGYRLAHAGMAPAGVHARVMETLLQVGLAQDAQKLPAQLSGGMQKRAALAAALIHRPAVLLLDDPTAGLDAITTASVMHFILEVAQRQGAAVLCVTHDLTGVAKHLQQVWLLRGGTLHRQTDNPARWAAALGA